jgi:hypothetical protein
MREVELFRWWVRAAGRKRAYLTRFLMDAETAQAQYPGARPEPTSRTIRLVPETDEERRAAHFLSQSAGQDSVKPPKR